MPNYAKLAKGLSGLMKGADDVLPMAEREANKARFLAESKAPGLFYHGTNSDIPSFRADRKGTFVSPDPKFANRFAEDMGDGREGVVNSPNVMPVRVQVKNPFDFANPEHISAINEAARKRFPGNTNVQSHIKVLPHSSDNWDSIEHPDVQALIKGMGHDSYYTRESGVKNLSIYDPKKIKSDIGNKGTYDVNKAEINEAKGGAIKMQAGGLSALAKLGTAGTKLTKAEMAALRARGMGVPGIDFADPLAAPGMRMSEALGNAGAEGKWLNFTEADRSRVFGPNKGGTGFSALQHYSEPHKEARTVWGFGNKSTAEKKIRQNDPENTIWTTYAGSPEQHKSNTVVVKDAVKTLQEANAKGAVHPEQVRLINERIRQATSDKGAPLFPSDFDITDPQALSLATTFDRRTAISDALMGTGVKKPMISKEFKAANPGVQWNDASDISRILTRETDPALSNANTFDVGPHLFTMENKIIHRPDLNEAFPVQVTGDDLGMRFKPAPFRTAAPEFIKEKGYGPNDPINAWAMSRGNPRQFVDEKYLTGMQKEGHKDGGSVQPSFTQRLSSAIEHHMAEGGSIDNTTPDMTDGGQINYGGQYKGGGKVHMPITSLKQVKSRRYAEAGSVEPLGAPDYQTGPQDSRMMELAGRMIKDQAKKEGAVLSTPEGRRDIALKVASHMPGLGMGGDLVSLADWVQTLIPGLYEEKPTSVLDTKKAAAPYRDVRELQRVPKFPLRNVIGSPTGEEFQEKFKQAGWQGENEAPVSEFIGSLFTPGAIGKAAKAPRAIEGGLNSVTAAARRPFTPATVTTEAVAPDLAKYKSREFQDYATKQMIGEGAAVPMTSMGGRKTTQRPGQGVYMNEAGKLELNPMVGVDVPRAGNLSKNKALRGDIATAGQELNQEAMAAHRFVPMATNNIKDASSMMITGPGGRALTNDEVIALGKRLPDMIVSHSPRTGGVFVAPFSMEKGKIPQEFLDAQSAAGAVLGNKAKIQFGKSDPNKDLMYMGRSDYGTEGGRGTSQAAQAVRKSLKRMDQTIPAR